MLPELVLDNENFDEIMAAARNRIISLYPEWTDFNYHDPGITLIELFSWLKESQQFFMDQVGDDTREAYLKLLGMRRRTKIPARTQVQVQPAEDITVLAGTRLWAGDTCFEADEKKQLTGGDVSCCLCGGESLLWQAKRSRLRLGQGLRQPLFGSPAEEGNCLYIGFDRSLPREETLDVRLDLFDRYPVKRNPVQGAMAEPMACLSLQYFGDGQWRDGTGVRDETLGAIRSGRIYFSLPGEMEETEVFGSRGFFVRIRLESQSYEIPPVLEHLTANSLAVTQRETLAEYVDTECRLEGPGQASCQVETLGALNGRNDLFFLTGDCLRRIHQFQKLPDFDTGVTTFHFALPEGVAGDGRTPGKVRVVSVRPEEEGLKNLGVGTGLPSQEFPMSDPDVEYETFGLMVLEGDSYRIWEKVADFSCSGPEDRHYTLDSRTGTVRFGDCIRGMAPEAEILVFSRSRTKGRRGNVKAGAIDRFDGMEPQDVPVGNREDCVGGRDEESLEESFLRAKRELKQPFTAVSSADIERCVMETPGLMLENCRVIPREKMAQIQRKAEDGKIYIVVNPFSRDGERGLTECCRKNILAWLEPRRMAGRQFVLLPPQHVPFEVYADVVLLPHYSDGREQVRRTVEAYFEEIRGDFGAVAEYGELYGRIDMLLCVDRVNSLNMDARGSGVIRRKDGSLELPPNAVPRLKDARYMFSVG